MRHRPQLWRRGLLMLMVTALLGALVPGQAQAQDTSVPQEWQRGVTVVPQSRDELTSPGFRQAMEQAAASNANFVSLVIQYQQSEPARANIRATSSTPTDAALIDGIQHIHDLGMQVNLIFHVGLADGRWRAHIDPFWRWKWFQRYRYMLLHYANIAEANGVEMMTLGAEMVQTTDPEVRRSNTFYWRWLIRSVRARYSGDLTYSAAWGGRDWLEEKDAIRFWNELDYIGISAYFPFREDYTAESLRQQWTEFNRQHVQPLHERWNKPVIFTEVGYRSADGALRQPWNYETVSPPDQQEQADGYEALLSYWSAVPYMQGVHFWGWESDPHAGGSGDSEFTPQRKLAQGVMTDWFTRMAGDEPPPFEPVLPILDVAPSVEAVYPLGEEAALNVTVENEGVAIEDVLVDVEVYRNGERVHQEFFPDQSFAAGQAREYAVRMTPSETGEYIMKVGLFRGDWEELMVWKDSAAMFRVEH